MKSFIILLWLFSIGETSKILPSDEQQTFPYFEHIGDIGQVHYVTIEGELPKSNIEEQMKELHNFWNENLKIPVEEEINLLKSVPSCSHCFTTAEDLIGGKEEYIGLWTKNSKAMETLQNWYSGKNNKVHTVSKYGKKMNSVHMKYNSTYKETPFNQPKGLVLDQLKQVIKVARELNEELSIRKEIFFAAIEGKFRAEFIQYFNVEEALKKKNISINEWDASQQQLQFVGTGNEVKLILKVKFLKNVMQLKKLIVPPMKIEGTLNHVLIRAKGLEEFIAINHEPFSHAPDTYATFDKTGLKNNCVLVDSLYECKDMNFEMRKDTHSCVSAFYHKDVEKVLHYCDIFVETKNFWEVLEDKLYIKSEELNQIKFQCQNTKDVDHDLEPALNVFKLPSDCDIIINEDVTIVQSEPQYHVLNKAEPFFKTKFFVRSLGTEIKRKYPSIKRTLNLPSKTLITNIKENRDLYNIFLSLNVITWSVTMIIIVSAMLFLYKRLKKHISQFVTKSTRSQSALQHEEFELFKRKVEERLDNLPTTLKKD